MTRGVHENGLGQFCRHQVWEWRPGTYVEVRRPLQPKIIRASLFLAALYFSICLLVPALAWFEGRDIGAGFILTWAGFGALGLIPATFIAGRGMPESIRIDWGSEILTVRRMLWARQYPFRALTRIELYVVRYKNQTESSEATGEMMDYLASVQAIRPVWKLERVQQILEFVGTDARDPEPVERARAVAIELAQAMGLPFREETVVGERSE